MLRVLDVATGEVVDGPIDRARYSPVAWLPRAAGRPGPLLLRPPPGAGAAAGRRAAVPPPGLPARRRHLARDRRRGVRRRPRHDDVLRRRTSHDGRWLVVSAAAGTAPRTDVWLADLAAGDPAAPGVPRGRRRPRRRARRLGRARRPALRAHRPRRPARAALRGRPRRPRPRALGRPGAGGPDRGARRRRRARLRRRWPSRCCSCSAPGTPSASSPCTAWPTAAHVRDVALPGLGLARRRWSRRGRTATARGSRRPTTPRPGRVLRLDGRTLEVTVAELPPGEPPPAPDVTAQQLTCTSRGRHDGALRGPRARRRARSTAAPRQPAPTVLYGYGGFGISLTPGLLRDHARLGPGRRRPRRRRPARRRRGGRGLAPRRLPGPQAERLRRPVRRRRDRCSPTAGPRRTGSRSPAGPTAGCSSAPRSPSAPTCGPPCSAPPRCSTWSATSSTASG